MDQLSLCYINPLILPHDHHSNNHLSSILVMSQPWNFTTADEEIQRIQNICRQNAQAQAHVFDLNLVGNNSTHEEPEVSAGNGVGAVGAMSLPDPLVHYGNTLKTAMKLSPPISSAIDQYIRVRQLFNIPCSNIYHSHYLALSC